MYARIAKAALSMYMYNSASSKSKEKKNISLGRILKMLPHLAWTSKGKIMPTVKDKCFPRSYSHYSDNTGLPLPQADSSD
jgi:hypothetical protein